ncbi:MAG: hypothetical protein KGD57_00775, partial [Candidatus Lokiarchaeota archaeon]|nr:hypothetical protein [Candidatus Lokiarchaeota archaeon]
MPDGWEVDNDLKPTTPDASGDLDEDDLTNLYEYNNGLLANNNDTDSDGMPDGWEDSYVIIEPYSLDPKIDDAESDPDDDQLDNLGEYTHGTSPYNDDCDNDGYSDGAEVNAGTDPLNPESHPSQGGIDIPWYLQALLGGIISATVGIAIKITYSRFKKRQQLLSKMLFRIKKIDNIESFLKEKLGYKEWLKLKEPLEQYQNREINSKALIKRGKKELGDKFMDAFIDNSRHN